MAATGSTAGRGCFSVTSFSAGLTLLLTTGAVATFSETTGRLVAAVEVLEGVSSTLEPPQQPRKDRNPPFLRFVEAGLGARVAAAATGAGVFEVEAAGVGVEATLAGAEGGGAVVVAGEDLAVSEGEGVVGRAAVLVEECPVVSETVEERLVSSTPLETTGAPRTGRPLASPLVEEVNVGTSSPTSLLTSQLPSETTVVDSLPLSPRALAVEGRLSALGGRAGFAPGLGEFGDSRSV